MCGRYQRRSDKQRIAEAFKLGNVGSLFLQLAPDYNAAPGKMHPVIVWDASEGMRTLQMMYWKFLPTFCTDPKKFKLSTTNADSANLLTSRMWKDSFLNRRCLIPADTFIEWQTEGKAKLPWMFAMKDDEPFALGGRVIISRDHPWLSRGSSFLSVRRAHLTVANHLEVYTATFWPNSIREGRVRQTAAPLLRSPSFGMSEKGVLRYMEANSHRGGIAVADFKVDVGHRRVKRVGVCVGDMVVGRNGTGRRKGDTAAGTGGLVGCEAGEHDHDSHTSLEAWRLGRQHEDGTCGAIADEAHAGPNIDCMSRSLVSMFFLIRAFAFAVVFTVVVALHRVCIRTLMSRMRPGLGAS
jgi:hypothetical protein